MSIKKIVILLPILMAGIAGHTQFYPSDSLFWFGEKGKYGYKDGNGKVVIAPQYDFCYAFSEGLAAVQLKERYGFVDKSGNIVVPCQYSGAGNFSEGLAAVNIGGKRDALGEISGGKWGYIDKSGKLIIGALYDAAGDFREGMAYVARNHKFGYINKTGQLLVPMQYDFAAGFSEGLAAVNKGAVYNENFLGYGGGLWGFIDKTGKLITPVKYTGTEPFSEGLAVVETGAKDLLGTGKKCGYIDRTGKEVIPLQFDEAKSFHGGLAVIGKDYFAMKGGSDKQAVIDKTGKIVIDFNYNIISDFNKGIAVVRNFRFLGTDEQDTTGVIDRNGKIIVPMGAYRYFETQRIAGLLYINNKGLFKAKVRNQIAYINLKGEEVTLEGKPVSVRIALAPKYPVKGILIPFSEKGKWGYKDTSGKTVVVQARYDAAYDFSEGMGLVKNNGKDDNDPAKIGFVDHTGKLVIALKYSFAESFSEGLAMVATGKHPDVKYGFIDKTGKEVIPLRYESAQSFMEARAGVMKNGKFGYIDRQGNPAIPFNYVDGMPFSLGKAAVAPAADKKMGLIDREGKMIVQPAYSLVYPFKEYFARVATGSFPDMKYGFINDLGKAVIPCQYGRARDFSEGFAAVSLTGSLSSKKNEPSFQYIDNTGKIKITEMFVEAYDFKEGLAHVVTKDQRHWYIDKSNKKIFEVKPGYMEFPGDFENGKAAVRKDGEIVYYYDRKGTKYTPDGKLLTIADPAVNPANKPVVNTGTPRLLFEDEFDNNSKQWPLASNENAEISITGGNLKFKMKQSNYYMLWLNKGGIEQLDPSRDFTIETEIRMLSGDVNTPYYLLWGVKDVNTKFGFAVFPTGHFEFSKTVNGPGMVILEKMFAATIAKGVNMSNKIAIKKEGSVMKFYINNQLVKWCSYQPFEKGTGIGFMVHNTKEIAVNYLQVLQ